MEVFLVFFYLAIDHVPLELVLFVVTNQFDGIVHNLLLFPELTRMDDDKILAEVQFADIFTQAAIHGESQRQFLLHLLLQETSDLMLEKFLPTHSFLGIGLQHLSDQILAHVGDVVDCPREVDVLLVDHHLEFIDVLGVEWRSK